MILASLSKHQVSVGVILILHTVGIFGMALAKEWFIPLTPLNLIVSGYFVLRHAEKPRYGLYLLIAALAFGIEAIGVATGFPFGDYSYEQALGPHIIEVPLLIGLLWLLLLQGALHLCSKWVKGFFPRVLLVALMLTGVDLLIEPVAMDFAYWQWYGEDVPLNNYLGWFGTAFILGGLGHRFDPNFGNNRVAGVFFLVQVGFFISINLLVL